MKVLGARALRDKAIVYVIDSLEQGCLERSGLAVMNRVAREGGATFLVASVSPEEAAGMQLACHDVFSIPELASTQAGFARFRSGLVAFVKMCRVLYDLSSCYGEVIVHTHGIRAGFIGRWAAWLTGAGQTVHTVYQYPFHNGQKAYVWWAGYIAEYATSWVTSQYLCFSSKDKALGSRLLPYFSKRALLVGMPIDWKHFYTPELELSSRRVPASPIVIGMVLDPGFFEREALYAFARLIESLAGMGVPVVGQVVGMISWRWEYTQWLLEAGLQNMVHLLGWQAQQPETFRNWHVAVSCSLSDASMPGLVQARLLWVPVVSYATGGVRDVITHDKNGLLVAPGDEAALFKAVYKILIDRPLYERLASQGEDLNRYSEGAVAVRHVKLYKSVA